MNRIAVAVVPLRKASIAAVATLALIASLGSLYLLVDFVESTGDLIAFFAVQAVASTLLALATAAALPENWRRPPGAVFALLFSFAFFIPIFGAAGMLIAVTVTLILPKRWRYRDFSEIMAPEFAPLDRESPDQLRISSLRTALLDQTAPAEVRMRFRALRVGQLPHEPVQPSLPHSKPAHAGTHRHAPFALQVCGGVHEPHVPPHPSEPHVRPMQSGTQIHWPAVSHVRGAGQSPHEPPQPSSPHIRPPQFGVHSH